MSPNDEKLKALLQQWRDIAPPANFEANVWRQIRLAQARQAARITIAEWLRRLVWQPAFSVGVAVAVVIGVWGGMHSAPPSTATHYAEVGFLSPGTLAGSYARLAGGESR
jgi:hypothetical protein